VSVDVNVVYAFCFRSVSSDVNIHSLKVVCEFVDCRIRVNAPRITC